MKKQKINKTKLLPPRIIRQLEILSKYYEIDMEKRLIKVELHFDSVDEIFANDIRTLKGPIFKTEVLQRVSEILDSFPAEFKTDLSLQIDDYQGYDPVEITRSFKDSLELFHYSVERIKSYRWIEAVILALISVAILFIRRFALQHSVITDNNLVTEMLDITAWVFLWQAVTILFLLPDDHRDISFRLLDRINSFTLKDANLIPTMYMNRQAVVESWVYVSGKEKFSSKLLLICGAIALATGIILLVDSVEITISLMTSAPIGLIIALILVFFFVSAIPVLGGIGAISLYREKGPLRKIVPVIAYIYLIFDVLYLGLIIYFCISQGISISGLLKVLVSAIISLMSSILFFVSYIILKRARKDAREQLKKK